MAELGDNLDQYAPEDWSDQAGIGFSHGRMQGVGGLVIHYTGDHHSNEQGIVDAKTPNPAAGGAMVGPQFRMDRDGEIIRLVPEGAKMAHMLPGWGPMGSGRSNSNMEGIEIAATGPNDLTDAQRAKIPGFVAWHSNINGYDPTQNVFGHSEVNPGHRTSEMNDWAMGIREGAIPLPQPGPAQDVSEKPLPDQGTQPTIGPAAPIETPSPAAVAAAKPPDTTDPEAYGYFGGMPTPAPAPQLVAEGTTPAPSSSGSAPAQGFLGLLGVSQDTADKLSDTFQDAQDNQQQQPGGGDQSDPFAKFGQQIAQQSAQAGQAPKIQVRQPDYQKLAALMAASSRLGGNVQPALGAGIGNLGLIGGV